MRVLLSQQPARDASLVSLHVGKLSRGEWYQLYLATPDESKLGSAQVTISAHLSSKGVSFRMSRTIAQVSTRDIAVATRFWTQPLLVEEIIRICNRRNTRGSSVANPHPFNPTITAAQALADKWGARISGSPHLGAICLFAEADECCHK